MVYAASLLCFQKQNGWQRLVYQENFLLLLASETYNFLLFSLSEFAAAFEATMPCLLSTLLLLKIYTVVI